MTFTTARNALIAAAALATIAGCTTNKDADKNWQDPFFPPAQSTTPTKAILERQYAAGALEDGMFHAIHFDGDALNTLGQQKLRAMVVARPANTPLRVYLNLPGTQMASATRPAAAAATSRPSDESVARRQASLEQALAGMGLTPGEYVVATGPNPEALRPADAGVRALQPPGSAFNANSVVGPSH